MTTMSSFPAADPGPLTTLVSALGRLRDGMYDAVGSVDGAALTSQPWTGAAGDAFRARAQALAAATAEAAESAVAIVPALREMAAAIESCRGRHDAGADLEQAALPYLPDTRGAVAAGQRAQAEAITAYRTSAARCAAAVSAAAARLAAIDADPTVDGTDAAGGFVDGEFYAGTERDPLGWIGGSQQSPQWSMLDPDDPTCPPPDQVPSGQMPYPDTSQRNKWGNAYPSTDPSVRWILPDRGEGYVVYNQNDSALSAFAPADARARHPRERGVLDQVGTRHTIESQQRIAGEWSVLSPGRPLEYGDVSLQGGLSTADHSTHGDGQAFDMRPIRQAGTGSAGFTYDQSTVYDQEATKDFLRLLRRQHPDATVYFNDPQVRDDPEFRGWVSYSADHDNHLHVIIPGGD